MSLAIGKRIRFFRKRSGLTLRELGMAAGFPLRSANIHIAQYEAGVRNPKAKVIYHLAKALGVSPNALLLPEIDNPAGLMHTLFALEDIYGFSVENTQNGLFLRLGDTNNSELNRSLMTWGMKRLELDTGLMSKKEYDQWRYNFSGSGKEDYEI